MSLARFTEPNLLVASLLSNSRESAIAELSALLEKSERIENAGAFTREVCEHESIASAVFDQVAFSLARTEAARELSFAIGLSQKGIPWGIVKPTIVYAVVLFAVPLSAEQPYQSLVLTFSRFIMNEKAFSALRRSGEPGEMLAELKQIRLRQTGPKQEFGQD